MKKEICTMLPNDYIYMENDDMWLVDRNTNDLYRGKVSTKKCEYVAQIPISKNAFRENPGCVKCDNIIVCLPMKGEYIWMYNIEEEIFEKIEIINAKSILPEMQYFWKIDEMLWIWAMGLKSFVELDVKKKKIKGYYHISEFNNEVLSNQVVRVENALYLFSDTKKMLYEFDTVSKKIIKYNIEGICESGINTISFDGMFFWFSGFRECIYRWNKITQKLQGYTDFPKEFKVTRNGQKPLFHKSVILGDYVCFIPWNYPETVCNGILFVNRNTYEMKVLKIYAENDDGTGGYIYEYGISDRYMGIYYSSNCFISEIDLETFEIQKRPINFEVENYAKMLKSKMEKGEVLRENGSEDLSLFLNLC